MNAVQLATVNTIKTAIITFSFDDISADHAHDFGGGQTPKRMVTIKRHQATIRIGSIDIAGARKGAAAKQREAVNEAIAAAFRRRDSA